MMEILATDIKRGKYNKQKKTAGYAGLLISISIICPTAAIAVVTSSVSLFNYTVIRKQSQNF